MKNTGEECLARSAVVQCQGFADLTSTLSGTVIRVTWSFLSTDTGTQEGWMIMAESTKFVYGMRLRGFSPGCQPMDGWMDTVTEVSDMTL